MNCLGTLGYDLYNKLCFGVYEAGNDHDIWFPKEEPMLDEWAAHGQPTCSVLELKNSTSLYEMDQKCP